MIHDGYEQYVYKIARVEMILHILHIILFIHRADDDDGAK